MVSVLSSAGCTSTSNNSQSCEKGVNITWLGVTTYAIEYEFNGNPVKLLLDHQINGAYFDEVMTNLGAESLDLVVIGHNHFDHTGNCLEQDDFLCNAALAVFGEPDLAWVGAPYSVHAHNQYGAHIVGPYNICDAIAEDACSGLWSTDGVQTLRYDELGLKITAFPSAHSSDFGAPDYLREHPDSDDPDPYTFIFDFFDSDVGCPTSMMWASSTLSSSPYLEYTETLNHDDQEWSFDYQALLQEAMNLREGQPITYWTFWGSALPQTEWQKWADIIQPQYWSNHHHGTLSSEFFPDLHLPFQGIAIGGSETEPASDWIDESTNAPIPFIPLSNFWDTVQLKDGKAVPVSEKQKERSENFKALVADSLGI